MLSHCHTCKQLEAPWTIEICDHMSLRDEQPHEARIWVLGASHLGVKRQLLPAQTGQIAAWTGHKLEHSCESAQPHLTISPDAPGPKRVRQ